MSYKDGPFDTAGVGRIRRDLYELHFGAQKVDVDLLRHYVIASELRPLLTPLAPLTAQEALWVQFFFGKSDPQLIKLLMELSCASGNPAPCPETPSSASPALLG